VEFPYLEKKNSGRKKFVTSCYLKVGKQKALLPKSGIGDPNTEGDEKKSGAATSEQKKQLRVKATGFWAPTGALVAVTKGGGHLFQDHLGASDPRDN